MTLIGCRKECYNLGSRMWVEAGVPRGSGMWEEEACIVFLTLNLEEFGILKTIIYEKENNLGDIFRYVVY